MISSDQFKVFIFCCVFSLVDLDEMFQNSQLRYVLALTFCIAVKAGFKMAQS